MRRNQPAVLWSVILTLAITIRPGMAWSQTAREVQPLRLPGQQPAGQILLPNQWSLRPAGKQLKLGDFPVNIALHPREPWAAILHAGYGDHEIVIVDLKSQAIVSRATIDEAYYGLCFDPEGKQVFASGAEHEFVHQFRFDQGYLSQHRTLPVGDPKQTLVPTGVSCDRTGQTLYVANAFGDTLCILPVSQPEQRQHVAFRKGSYPYAALPSHDGARLFVSLWGDASVAIVDLQARKVLASWKTEAHPTEMALSPDGQRLYVACANSNTVSVLGTGSGKALEVIATALYPQAPNGSTPNSLSLTPDGQILLVANADNSNIALFNVSRAGKSQSLGFIPVGWYPTSVRFSPLDKRIYVANGKGLMSQANPQGPNPLKDPPATVRQYIAGLFRGTLSVIDFPSPEALARYSEQAFQCSPLRADRSPVSTSPETDNPIPAKVGLPSPIKHCIYIIKENRTYDQVFGDLPQGNGDPNLCIFPRQVTPNHHALVEEFVLLDNFYVESEVSADGHEWSMAAYATDFVEKTWPLGYRGSRKGKVGYTSEGHRDIAIPNGGYIWDNCRRANVSYRSYGEWITNGAKPGEPARANVPALEGHFDPLFHGYDLDYPDVKRTARFVEELTRFEQEGQLPQFIVLRLPNDHTQGQKAGKPTPTAMVADNDLALGRLVEAVSKSRFWKDTAIFVVEDDAQNGSDHVDAHRTVALVISPYTKRHYVDSSMYSTASMLRTMELILGLHPMSQFDAAARPMHAAFTARPDLSSYNHRPAGVDIALLNPSGTQSAKLSAAMDFSREDAADDLLLNEVVWKSVRGEESSMPPPVRAAFVLAHQDDDEDDDDK